MRFEKFTIKAQEAVVRAQQMAQEMNHAEITPLHLLSALLGETDGVVRPLLQKLGADPDRLTQITESELERLPKATGTQTGPSRALNDVFNHAQGCRSAQG
jgi:ATP-dependent Clp protease ATP-binding subunit ClpB